jgi:hypothetical protein
MKNNELKSIRICFNGEHGTLTYPADFELLAHIKAAIQSELQAVMGRKIRLNYTPNSTVFADVTFTLAEEEEPAEQQSI